MTVMGLIFSLMYSAFKFWLVAGALYTYVECKSSDNEFCVAYVQGFDSSARK